MKNSSLADLHPVLPPHEGEALAEFEQELLQVLHQPVSSSRSRNGSVSVRKSKT